MGQRAVSCLTAFGRAMTDGAFGWKRLRDTPLLSSKRLTTLSYEAASCGRDHLLVLITKVMPWICSRLSPGPVSCDRAALHRGTTGVPR